MGFKCPEPGCGNATLIKVGAEVNEDGEARPTLKRRKREEFIPVPGLEDMKDNLGSAEPEELLDFGEEAAPAALDLDDFDE
ncbi:MAG: hypothetical protein HYV27_02635 [Candidatus Hydrogenedentes bacterium]|nr:hypothetical protein [Candidatus Hydrogenedentota bacterium]